MSDPVPHRFEAAYRVRFDEAGVDGLVRASSLLRYAQDAAWQHGAALGLTRDWYEEHQLVWLVRAVDLVLARPMPVGARLDVTTAVVGHRRVWARRRVELRLAGDPPAAPPAAVALTDWVLIDGTGRLVRIPESFSTLFGVPAADFEMTRVPAASAPEGAASVALAVRPHEVDPNGHLNNAVYLDWLEEAVAAANGAPDLARLPRRYRVEYLQALAQGAEANVVAWQPPPGGAGATASAGAAASMASAAWHGSVVRGADGVAAARARLTLGSEPA